MCSTAKFKLILTYTHVCYERCTLRRHQHRPRSSLNLPPPFSRLSFWIAFFPHCFCMSFCSWYSWAIEWHWITCLMCVRFRLWLSLRFLLLLLLLGINIIYWTMMMTLIHRSFLHIELRNRMLLIVLVHFLDDPLDSWQAVQSLHKKHWLEAMQFEFHSLLQKSDPESCRCSSGQCVFWAKFLQVFDIWNAKTCTKIKCTSIDTHNLDFDM